MLITHIYLSVLRRGKNKTKTTYLLRYTRIYAYTLRTGTPFRTLSLFFVVSFFSHCPLFIFFLFIWATRKPITPNSKKNPNIYPQGAGRGKGREGRGRWGGRGKTTILILNGYLYGDLSELTSILSS